MGIGKVPQSNVLLHNSTLNLLDSTHWVEGPVMKVESNREKVKENCFKKKNTVSRGSHRRKSLARGLCVLSSPRFHLHKDSICVHQHIGSLLLYATCCAEICPMSSTNPPAHTMGWVMIFPLEKGYGSSNWETNWPWLYTASSGQCSDFKPDLSADKSRALNHSGLHEKLTNGNYIPFGKQGSLLGSWLKSKVKKNSRQGLFMHQQISSVDPPCTHISLHKMNLSFGSGASPHPRHSGALIGLWNSPGSPLCWEPSGSGSEPTGPFSEWCFSMCKTHRITKEINYIQMHLQKYKNKTKQNSTLLYNNKLKNKDLTMDLILIIISKCWGV